MLVFKNPLSLYRMGNTVVMILILIASTVWGVYFNSIPWFCGDLPAWAESDALLTCAYIVSSLLGLLVAVNVLDLTSRRYWPALLFVLLMGWGIVAMRQYGWGWPLRVLYINLCLCVGFLPYLRQQVQPRLTYEPDMLGRRQIYNQSAKMLRDLVGEKDSEGRSVAVYGRWGIGKTHFVNYLSARLAQVAEPSDISGKVEGAFTGRFIVSKVDLWRCRSVDEAWAEVTDALLASITHRRFPAFKRIRRFLYSMAWMVPFNISSVFGSIMQFMYASSSKSGEAEHVLREYMNTVRRNEALLLVLDNVDRCDKDIVMSLFSLTERLKLVPRLLVVCCIAREELSWRFGSGSGYEEVILQRVLDKLFDVVIELPPVTVSQEKTLMLTSAKGEYPDCVLLQKWLSDCKLIFDTPRQIKRVISQLAMYEQCYLQRLCQDALDGTLPAEIERRANCVFNVETMRLLYPSVSFLLGVNAPAFARKVRALMLYPDFLASGEFNGISPEEKECVEKLMKESPALVQHLREDRLFRSLLQALDESSQEDLIYALGKDCVTLCELNNAECQYVIKCWSACKEAARAIPEKKKISRLYRWLHPFRKQDETQDEKPVQEKLVSPYSVFRHEFENGYRQENEFRLYIAVLIYALNAMKTDTNAYKYVQEVYKADFKKNVELAKIISNEEDSLYWLIYLKIAHYQGEIDGSAKRIHLLTLLEKGCYTYASDEIIKNVSQNIFRKQLDESITEDRIKAIHDYYKEDGNAKALRMLLETLINKTLVQISNGDRNPLYFQVLPYLSDALSADVVKILSESTVNKKSTENYTVHMVRILCESIIGRAGLVPRTAIQLKTAFTVWVLMKGSFVDENSASSKYQLMVCYQEHNVAREIGRAQKNILRDDRISAAEKEAYKSLFRDIDDYFNGVF